MTTSSNVPLLPAHLAQLQQTARDLSGYAKVAEQLSAAQSNTAGSDQATSVGMVMEGNPLLVAPAQPPCQLPPVEFRPGQPERAKRTVNVDLTLTGAPDGGYAADLRVTLPESVAPVNPLPLPAPVVFDLARLRALALDPGAYGAALSTMLFASPALRTGFAQARAVAAQKAAPLRLCLSIQPAAEELHTLRWECLTDPDTHQPLATSTCLLLSRTLTSPDWQPVREHTAGPLRAVALVAAPPDLPDYGLFPLDAAQETARIRTQLRGCDLTVLGEVEGANLPALFPYLHTGCDLLFVLAHCRHDEQGQTWLYLEDTSGRTAPIPGSALLVRIAALANKPRLIILGCCESAGDGSGPALRALGPQLIRAGVPAVLAMQGRISHETLAHFLPACLQALMQNGQIDRAVALARGQVRDRPDWWAPVLWMRLGAGNTIRSIDTIQGIQEGVTIISEEQSYQVAGLPNPYLGLRAFTAAEQDIFAGRERLVQALVPRLAAENGDRLLFLVGASGSGKSSLARAGLLPALEARLREQHVTVATYILDHPGRTPTATLTHLLHSIAGSPTSVLLVLIDQFEELFSQTEPDEAQHALDLLLEIVVRSNHALRIIATLRSDFLPQLAADGRFECYEQRKVMVRTMSVDELADAIQRPLQLRRSDKRLEGALVERLAHDASVDASYLPLLQITLEDLWRGGNLRLSAYKGLATAIQRRAETVFTYRDHDTLRQEPRSKAEQQELLELLLDLVRVSPGEEQQVTRWRRTRAELIQSKPQRERLVADLTAARLLCTDHETELGDGDESRVETVDVVHEALLSGWSRLKDAIEGERERLRRRERFLLALQEWLSQARHDDYLLGEVRLAEAKALRWCGDSVFAQEDAQQFYKRSSERRDRARQRQIQRTRMVVAVLIVLTLLALLAAGVAGWFGVMVQQQLRVAESRRLAAEAISLLAQNAHPERALLLALEAVGMDTNPTTREAIQQAVAAQPYHVLPLAGHTDAVNSAVFSPDGQHILTASGRYSTTAANVTSDTTARLWDATGKLLATLIGHTDAVLSAVFSPDGQRILTASWDGTARLWDATGEPLAILTVAGRSDRITNALFSPDGQHILTASWDGTVRLWDAAGKPLATLSGHTAPIISAAFSPDGQHFLTTSYDGTARLWHTTGKPIATLSGHTAPVISAVFSPDGQHILTASGDDMARLWDTTGKPLVTLAGHTSVVRSAVFSPDGHSILTTSEDTTARLWDTAGKPLFTLVGHTAPVVSGVFSPDGQHVLTASDDGTARLWDTTGKLLATLAGHTDTVNSAMFSPDGLRILTASNDGMARLWDTEVQPLATLGHIDTVWRAVFSPDGLRILTASDDGMARLWDTEGQQLATLAGHTQDVGSATFSSDGQRILTASQDTTARLWDATGHPLATLSGHTASVWCAVFSPDGRRILTASDDGTARLWDAAGRPLAVLVGERRLLTSAVFSPDGEHILTTSRDGTTRLWDTSGKLLTTFSGHTGVVWSGMFSPDGEHILTASEDTTARLWDTTGKLLAILAGHTGVVRSAVFSSDGKRILTASYDGTARLWDAAGHLLATLSGHGDDVLSAVFSPDGRHILTSSSNGTVRLRDAQGQTLTTLSGHGNSITSVEFSPDGQRILTASYDRTARLWPVELQNWLVAARCRVGRTLTAEEIRDYQVPTPLHFDSAAFEQRQCPLLYTWESRE